MGKIAVHSVSVSNESYDLEHVKPYADYYFAVPNRCSSSGKKKLKHLWKRTSAMTEYFYLVIQVLLIASSILGEEENGECVLGILCKHLTSWRLNKTQEGRKNEKCHSSE